MRTFISGLIIAATTATLATASLSATSASACDRYQPCAMQQGWNRDHDRNYGRHDNSGAILGAGIIGLALGAALASNHNSNDRDDRGYDNDYRGPSQDYGQRQTTWCHHTSDYFHPDLVSCNTFFGNDVPSTPGWWRR